MFQHLNYSGLSRTVCEIKSLPECLSVSYSSPFETDFYVESISAFHAISLTCIRKCATLSTNIRMVLVTFSLTIWQKCQPFYDSAMSKYSLTFKQMMFHCKQKCARGKERKDYSAFLKLPWTLPFVRDNRQYYYGNVWLTMQSSTYLFILFNKIYIRIVCIGLQSL